jgi:hypothetical protein
MTIRISELGNLTAVYGNVLIPVVAEIAGTLVTVKGNLDQITSYVNKAEAPYGNIIPDADQIYNLGTLTTRWKDIYLAGGTIYLGNANISVSNASVVTSLPLTSPSVNADTVNVSGNISANNISITGDFGVDDITATGTVSASDVTATGTVSAADVTATGTVSADDITATGVLTALDINTGNITANDITTSGTVSAGEITTTGNIIASNITVSGNTITLGSATLDVSSGSLESSIPIIADITSTANLTMQGARIEFAQGAYISEEEVFASPGQYSLTLTSAEDGIVGLNAIDANTTVLSSVIVSNSSVQINVANADLITGNINFWYYDSIGGIIFPDGTRQDTAYDVSINYSNVQVETYLPSYVGSIDGLTVSNDFAVLGNLFAANTYVPSASNSSGIAGQIGWDSEYLYICIDADTWKRANIATW